nr:MAG TPA: LysM [Crassvirales sp.]
MANWLDVIQSPFFDNPLRLPQQREIPDLPVRKRLSLEDMLRTSGGVMQQFTEIPLIQSLMRRGASPEQAMALYKQQLDQQGEIPYYEVQAGDNLSKIAKNNNNMSLAELRKMNPQQKSDVIRVGDRLNLGYETSPEWINVLDEEAKEAEWNKTNAGAILNYRHEEPYMVVDKGNKRLTIYDKNNNPQYTTQNISTGLSGNDYNTVTYVDENGKIRNMMGNNSTPAGITRIGGQGVYHGYPAFTRQRRNLDGTWEDIASSLHYGRVDKTHTSNGCVRVSGETLNQMANYVTEGMPVYTLPEKAGSRFVLRGGKLNYVADNPYGSETGKKQYWDDYNTHIDKSFNPLVITPTKKSGNAEYDYNVQSYANAISFNKEQLQKDLNLSSAEYNKMAQLAMGIAQNESKFGTATRYKQKPEWLQSMYHGMEALYKSRNWIGGIPLLELVGAWRGWKDPNNGFSNPFTTKIERNSLGISQIKYANDKETADLNKLYKQYGINSGDDLKDPQKSALATMVRLAYIYNTEVKGRNFEGAKKARISPWDALLYAYNGRKVQLIDKTATPKQNEYIRNIWRNSKNFEYLEYRNYRK